VSVNSLYVFAFSLEAHALLTSFLPTSCPYLLLPAVVVLLLDAALAAFISLPGAGEAEEEGGGEEVVAAEATILVVAASRSMLAMGLDGLRGLLRGVECRERGRGWCMSE